MPIATGGESSSTRMLAMISAVLGEIFSSNARSSLGSWVDIHSETLCRASSMINGEIYFIAVSKYIYGYAERLYASLGAISRISRSKLQRAL